MRLGPGRVARLLEAFIDVAQAVAGNAFLPDEGAGAARNDGPALPLERVGFTCAPATRVTLPSDPMLALRARRSSAASARVTQASAWAVSKKQWAVWAGRQAVARLQAERAQLMPDVARRHHQAAIDGGLRRLDGGR